MKLTTIIMLVNWASAFLPLLSHNLSSSLRGTIFAIKVTTGCRYGRTCLMVANLKVRSVATLLTGLL